jgi:hypothetical protein
MLKLALGGIAPRVFVDTNKMNIHVERRTRIIKESILNQSDNKSSSKKIRVI